MNDRQLLIHKLQYNYRYSRKNSGYSGKNDSYSQEKSLKDSKEKEKKGDERKEDLSLRTENGNPDFSCQIILQWWNTLISYGIEDIKDISPGTTRYENIQSCLKRHGLEAIFKAIENIKSSDFLLGKIKNWKVSFDWFVIPDNMEKVLNGDYDNRSANTSQNSFHNFDQRSYDYDALEDRLIANQHTRLANKQTDDHEHDLNQLSRES